MARSGGEAAQPGWQRLAHLIGAERGRRRWTVPELAARASLSARTVEYLESAARRRYRDSTLGKIEDAFGWKPGTIARIIDGQINPASQDPDLLLDRIVSRWPYLSMEERLAVVDLLETFTRRR